MIQQTRVSVDDFLALPEEKPYRELIAGEVVEKSMPNPVHGRTVSRLNALLVIHLDATLEAEVETEVRHADRPEDWVYLPDLSVTLTGRRPNDPAEERGPVEVAPDFAVEVLSPDDRWWRLQQRVEHYLRTGTRLVWMVDPMADTITVHEPGKPAVVLQRGDTADAAPVLRDFRLDLEEFFGRIHGEGR